jgi:hypothetical protein
MSMVVRLELPRRQTQGPSALILRRAVGSSVQPA